MRWTTTKSRKHFHVNEYYNRRKGYRYSSSFYVTRICRADDPCWLCESNKYCGSTSFQHLPTERHHCSRLRCWHHHFWSQGAARNFVSYSPLGNRYKHLWRATGYWKGNLRPKLRSFPHTLFKLSLYTEFIWIRRSWLQVTLYQPHLFCLKTERPQSQQRILLLPKKVSSQWVHSLEL